MLVFRGCLQEHLVSQSEIFGFQKSCYAKCVFHQKPQDFDHAEACAGGGSLGGVFFKARNQWDVPLKISSTPSEN